MNDRPALELARPREIRELLGDAARIFFRNFGLVFAIGLAIVLPVQLVVTGIGMEELTSSYKESYEPAEFAISALASYLLIAPLTAAAIVYVLRELAEGRRARPARAVQSGLDVFAPVFLAVLLSALGVALGLLVLVLPGIYLAVRWYFVPQAVVIDGVRGEGALRRSWEHTKGFWWRTFFVVLLANVVSFLPALVVLSPLEILASELDSQAVSLAGAILTESLTAPFVAIVSTLLFFDLRTRGANPPVAVD